MADEHAILRSPAQRRADPTAIGLSWSLAVVDTEPRSASGDVDDGACRTCSFVSFLQTRQDLARYRGLPQILQALRAEDMALPGASASRAVPPSSQFRLAPARRREGERVLHERVLADLSRSEIRPGDAVLLRPDGRGPASLLAELQHARELGVESVLIGYVRHADAIDHFAAFLEHPDLAAGWLGVLAQARQLGLSALGFAMAYPPCATLQWSGNRALEALRARLDLQFRRLDREASLMCPENVSGYSLLNDTRDALRSINVTATRLAVRTGDALLVF